MVEGAPDERGVYALWEDEELVYYGHASGRGTSIQRALRAHAAGGADACTGRATHYGWEICFDPAAREADLLAEFQARFNRLPRCNAAPP